MTVAKAEELIFPSNQTKTFPKTSNRGMKYVCIFLIYDPTLIKGIPLKIRKKGEMVRAYKEIHLFFESRGHKPKLHKMDNERYKGVKDSIATPQTK